MSAEGAQTEFDFSEFETEVTEADEGRYLLNETEVKHIIGFENQGIFREIDNRYRFAVTVFKNSGKTEVIRGVFQQTNPEILSDYRAHTIEIPRRVLAEYSPESGVFPFLTNQKEVDVLNEILKSPSVGEDLNNIWRIEPYAELHRSKDSDYFVDDESRGEYPIYEGKNIYQFTYDRRYFDLNPVSLWGFEKDTHPDKSAKSMIRSKRVNDLKKSIYDRFDGNKTSKSQIQFVNDLLKSKRGHPLSEEDVLPDWAEYRIVIRQVTNKTNERTLVAAVIPKDILCVHSLHTVRPFEPDPQEEDLHHSPLNSAWSRIFSDEELFVALGLLNSLPFDFLMRTKVESNMVMYKLRESQMPRLTEGDEWFEYIWTRAARLNCYGEEFEEMRDRLGGIEPATDPDEREMIQAELDAASFHAYGLDREQTAFILDDFHQVRDPRRMTDEYFDLVLEKYDILDS